MPLARGTNRERQDVSVKRGCLAGGATMCFALLALLFWHYRLETVESIVTANETGCAISMSSNGGWREEVRNSTVAYPLDIHVFVDKCPGVPEGRPYSAELVSVRSGKILASGLSCSGTEHAKDYPCRLEIPPLNTLVGQDHYRVRVLKVKGHKAKTAELQLLLKRQWRSLVFDALMSV